MSFCANCGNKLSDNALFCVQCGTKVPVTKEIDYRSSTESGLHQTNSQQDISAVEQTGRNKCFIFVIGAVAIVIAITYLVTAKPGISSTDGSNAKQITYSVDDSNVDIIEKNQDSFESTDEDNNLYYESGNSVAENNTESDIGSEDVDELIQSIIQYYKQSYGTDNVAAELDSGDKDSIIIRLYDPYAETTSDTLGVYEYNTNTGIWTDVVMGYTIDTNTDTDQDQDSGYMLEGSDSGYLDEKSLSGLTAWECRVARNEIYARHGRKFKDTALQKYFDSKSWYEPLYDPDKFDESMLSEWEKANANMIAAYEKKMGYR